MTTSVSVKALLLLRVICWRPDPENPSLVMDRFCEGGVAPLMLALAEHDRFTPEEIEVFKAMLDQLEETP